MTREIKLSAKEIIMLLQVKGLGRSKIFSLANNLIDGLDQQDLAELVIKNAINLKIPTQTKDEILTSFQKGVELYDKSISLGIKLIPYNDAAYPEQLKSISTPPVLLNAIGNHSALSTMEGVAVIGTRQPSDYGRQIGERIGFRLGESRINVISGLAIGCDTAAHIGSLKANGVTTAVLAHGLDTIYPKENSKLAQSILDHNGCLVSEYLLGTRGMPVYFIDRDRIQAGLAKATIVIETDVKGGTMHTVNNTIENKRILAAYKHPEQKRNEKSRGNEFIISSKGAIAIENLNDLNHIVEKVRPATPVNINDSGTSIDVIQLPAFDVDALVDKEYHLLKKKKKKSSSKTNSQQNTIQKKLYDNDRSDI